MPRSVVPHLQLIRLPNVFTAAADSLAGWLIVGGTIADVAGWLPLALASMALYAAGMALNDLFDLEVDRGERPGRPLPSGRVSPVFAARIGWGGLVLGPILAGVGGPSSSLDVALVLALAIFAYNRGVKRSILGPELMGACRGLNLLLGMAHAPALGGPVAWQAAFCYGAFVAGVTWISRSETRSGETRNL